MNGSHAVISWLIAIVFAALWVVVPTGLGLDEGEIMLWHVFMSLTALAMIVPCLYLLRPDTMLVGTFNGEIYEVYAATGNGNRGILGTGIVLIFPPILAKGYTLPISVVTVPFINVSAMTKAGTDAETEDERATPVTAFLRLQFRLSPNLMGIREFLQALPILQENRLDLTVPHKILFFAGMDAQGKPQTEERYCPCLAKILMVELQSTIAEATSRAIAEVSITPALLDRPLVEEKIKSQFERTVLAQANMLLEVTEPAHVCRLFDFNVEGVVPSDPETAKSLSAETKAQYTAKGQIAEAEGQKKVRELQAKGDTSYVRSVRKEALKPGGQLVLQAQMFERMKATTTIVGSPNMLLDAAAAKVVQSAPNPPPPTPTTP